MDQERLQRLLEKIDQLDADGLADLERVVDGLLAAQGTKANSRAAAAQAAYWLGILASSKKEGSPARLE